jgi:co-chaperonin GroES (HSP10)
MELLENRVMLSVLPAEQKTKSGIILPQGTASDLGIAEVLHVGRTHVLKPGQFVLFPKSLDCRIDWKGEQVLIAFEDDIIAVIEDPSMIG